MYQNKAIKFKEYKSAESWSDIVKKSKFSESNLIKLNANESPYGCLPEVIAEINNYKYFHYYPDPKQLKIRAAISKYVECKPENIVVGCGSDEILDLIYRLFTTKNDKILLFEPSFPYYQHLAKLNNLEIFTVNRIEINKYPVLNIEEIKKQNIKLIIISAPNNPTGDMPSDDFIIQLLNLGIPIVIDEAYFEFSSKTFWKLIKKYQHLIIVRTFSKLFALAGIRIGYAIANQNIIDDLIKIKPPYNISNFAEIMVIKSLKIKEKYFQHAAKIIETRDEVYDKLISKKGITIYHSHANFLLINFNKYLAKIVHKKLEEAGIFTRLYQNVQLSNCIRVSIGHKWQMDKFYNTLKNIISTM